MIADPIPEELGDSSTLWLDDPPMRRGRKEPAKSLVVKLAERLLARRTPAAVKGGL